MLTTRPVEKSTHAPGTCTATTINRPRLA
jgi:hypothetical protein